MLDLEEFSDFQLQEELKERHEKKQKEIEDALVRKRASYKGKLNDLLNRFLIESREEIYTINFTIEEILFEVNLCNSTNTVKCSMRTSDQPSFPSRLLSYFNIHELAELPPLPEFNALAHFVEKVSEYVEQLELAKSEEVFADISSHFIGDVEKVGQSNTHILNNWFKKK